jgi:hypothetical protein
LKTVSSVGITGPPGEVITIEPPVVSNVAVMVKRVSEPSTGNVNSRAPSAFVPLAHNTIAASGRDDSNMMVADLAISAGLRKNGCPPVSVAV